MPRKLRRIASHAPFCSTQGQADQGAFPRHPHRQRGNLPHGYLGVITNASLKWPQDVVGLNAIASKDMTSAILPPGGTVENRGAFGPAYPRRHVRIEMEYPRRDIELLDRHLARRASPFNGCH